MVVRIGDMRHSIRIERQSTTQDAAGQRALTWTEFATRRAAVEHANGTEIWASAQRSGRVPTVFRLRYLAGVTPDMRIVFDSRIFNILSVVDQEGRHEQLVITAQEEVGKVP